MSGQFSSRVEELATSLVGAAARAAGPAMVPWLGQLLPVLEQRLAATPTPSNTPWTPWVAPIAPQTPPTTPLVPTPFDPTSKPRSPHSSSTPHRINPNHSPFANDLKLNLNSSQTSV